MSVKFRFQDLIIWQKAIDMSDLLFDIGDMLEERKLYRFAEQLRGAVLSISNNIAEGSGSSSNKDFSNFLNHSQRSLFEVVYILIILERRKLMNAERLEKLLSELEVLSKQISSFKKSFANLALCSMLKNSLPHA